MVTWQSLYVKTGMDCPYTKKIGINEASPSPNLTWNYGQALIHEVESFCLINGFKSPTHHTDLPVCQFLWNCHTNPNHVWGPLLLYFSSIFSYKSSFSTYLEKPWEKLIHLAKLLPGVLVSNVLNTVLADHSWVIFLVRITQVLSY